MIKKNIYDISKVFIKSIRILEKKNLFSPNHLKQIFTYSHNI